MDLEKIELQKQDLLGYVNATINEAVSQKVALQQYIDFLSQNWDGEPAQEVINAVSTAMSEINAAVNIYADVKNTINNSLRW